VGKQSASASIALSLMYIDNRAPGYLMASSAVSIFVVVPFVTFVSHPCRRVVTLDAWETVPPGNESALMQVSRILQHTARTSIHNPSRACPSAPICSSCCCSMLLISREAITPLMQALVRHPVAVGMCVGPYIKSWRACVSLLSCCLHCSESSTDSTLLPQLRCDTTCDKRHTCSHLNLTDGIGTAGTRAVSLMADHARPRLITPWCDPGSV
jgi:hypothetical protein